MLAQLTSHCLERRLRSCARQSAPSSYKCYHHHHYYYYYYYYYYY